METLIANGSKFSAKNAQNKKQKESKKKMPVCL